MGPERQSSDGDLLQGMIAGDERAFAGLYGRWQGPLYRFALQMTGNAGLAEEIVQETFMTLMRTARNYDASRGPLPGFLYGICRNHVMRSVAVESPYLGLIEGAGENGHTLAELATSSNLLADLAAAQAVKRVRRAILSLPATYREAVVLCDLHEMTYEQAAGVLKCPVGTVRSRLHRGRELLLAKLRNWAVPAAGESAGAPRESEGIR
ncbi:MAG TPA: RNA polymerase sigma factor [Terriglobia bacterium]|nr:RNA polymerase sigma factor [Terriglobia bacterium]